MVTTDDGRVRPKHVLIEFKKWMCYIDGQKNKYSVLTWRILNILDVSTGFASVIKKYIRQSKQAVA
jgi:hypothetical protein